MDRTVSFSDADVMASVDSFAVAASCLFCSSHAQVLVFVTKIVQLHGPKMIIYWASKQGFRDGRVI